MKSNGTILDSAALLRKYCSPASRPLSKREIAVRYGRVLYAARVKANLMREELAASSGFDRTTIKELEQGLHCPNLDTVFQLARALELSVVDMIQQVMEGGSDV